MLILSDLHYSLPNQGPKLFDGLQLTLQAGERLAIVGAEGSGKSTLLRLMAGLIRPTSGRIEFCRQPVIRPPPQPGGIGLLFRDSASHFLTPMVGEEILFGLSKGTDLKGEEAVAQALQLSGLPPQAATWSLAALSAGQQARVAVAALLASQPGLILADEPGACLDEAGEDGLADIFRQRCEKGAVAQVVFTSRLRRANRFAERILLLNREFYHPTLSPLPQRAKVDISSIVWADKQV
jgi:energy-coupling factor transporter ATP-binding protein EcfA2